MVNEPWEILWDRAMQALDSLTLDHLRWSFGGGTAMRLFYNHRTSKDIDIFVTDPYMISGLSPRLNDATEKLTVDYDEQSNYLKLRFPEGEVDFIIAGTLLRAIPFVERSVRGRSVQVETPIEIVAKKCFYRGADLSARDIFDLAVLIEKEPNNVREYAQILLGRGDLVRRLSTLTSAPEASPESILLARQRRGQVQDAIDAISALGEYQRLKATALDTVMAFVLPGSKR